MANFLTHPIQPIYDENSKILILGSFPSPKSREKNIFYGHPQNRFWLVLSKLFDEEKPLTNEERKQFLLKHKIAVWDVVKECEIVGASDSSIKNVKVNDLKQIYKVANIRAVFTTGKTAYNLYKKYVDENVICLPSPSPANCAISIDNLIKEYSVIMEYLKD